MLCAIMWLLMLLLGQRDTVIDQSCRLQTEYKREGRSHRVTRQTGSKPEGSNTGNAQLERLTQGGKLYCFTVTERN